MCKTVKVEGFFPWLQYFEGKTSPCRIDKCNPCLANLISWNCSVDVVCTKLCARVQLVFLVRTNFVRRPFHWSKHIQSSAHFQYLEFFWVVRFQHNESLKSFDWLKKLRYFLKGPFDARSKYVKYILPLANRKDGVDTRKGLFSRFSKNQFVPILISFYMPAGSILNLRSFVNGVTTHCIERALFAVWV